MEGKRKRKTGIDTEHARKKAELGLCVFESCSRKPRTKRGIYCVNHFLAQTRKNIIKARVWKKKKCAKEKCNKKITGSNAKYCIDHTTSQKAYHDGAPLLGSLTKEQKATLDELNKPWGGLKII